MIIKTNLLVLPSVNNIEEIVEGNSTNIKLVKGSYRNLEFRFKDSNVRLVHLGIDIKKFSAIWLSSFWESRDLAYAVKLYLDHFKTPHTYVEKSISKITDQMSFIFSNILTPDTFFVDTHHIINYIGEIEKTCGYPLIIKDTKGSRGKYSAYIKNRKELLKKMLELPKYRKYLFQKFISNDFDWGVLVANGKVISAEKSYPRNNEFRNNTCNGAKEVFVKIEDIPKPIKNMAVKANKALGLSWSRSDIVVDKNSNIFYLLEVNRCPGITSGTSEMSGAQQFLKSYLDSINDKI